MVLYTDKEETKMPRRGHREEQILQALRLAESGTKAVEVCRRMGISEQTFYTWRRKYAGLELSELRELRPAVAGGRRTRG